MATFGRERTLRIREFVTAPRSYHLARLTLTVKTPEGIHDSDFHELFWVESGSGEHWINGTSYPLGAGSLVFVRPDDVHAVYASPDSSVGFVNVAFPTAKLAELSPNLRTAVRERFNGPAQSRHHRLGPFELHRLAVVTPLLELPQRGDAELQLLLLLVGRILEGLEDAKDPTDRARMPDWLADALAQLRNPDALRAGTSALVRFAGRGPDHVARVCRTHLGKTPTEIVNALRLEMAAERLAQTAEPIDVIAEACGMPNLSYFYRRFARQLGMTPAAYRKRALRIAGGGAPLLVDRPPVDPRSA